MTSYFEDLTIQPNPHALYHAKLVNMVMSISPIQRENFCILQDRHRRNIVGLIKFKKNIQTKLKIGNCYIVRLSRHTRKYWQPTKAMEIVRHVVDLYNAIDVRRVSFIYDTSNKEHLCEQSKHSVPSNKPYYQKLKEKPYYQKLKENHLMRRRKDALIR